MLEAPPPVGAPRYVLLHVVGRDDSLEAPVVIEFRGAEFAHKKDPVEQALKFWKYIEAMNNGGGGGGAKRGADLLRSNPLK